MRHRRQNLAERLRSAMGSDDTTTPARSASPRHAQGDKGAEFADRLRAAVAARR